MYLISDLLFSQETQRLNNSATQSHLIIHDNRIYDLKILVYLSLSLCAFMFVIVMIQFICLYRYISLISKIRSSTPKKSPAKTGTPPNVIVTPPLPSLLEKLRLQQLRPFDVSHLRNSRLPPIPNFIKNE